MKSNIVTVENIYYEYNSHYDDVLIACINILGSKIMHPQPNFTVIAIKTFTKWSKSLETKCTPNNFNVTSMISTID